MNATMRYAVLEQRRRNSDGTFAEENRGGIRAENANRYYGGSQRMEGRTYNEGQRMENRYEDESRRVEPGRDEPMHGNGTFRMRYEDGENRRMIGFGGEESRYTGPFKGNEFEHRTSPKERGYSHSTVYMPFDPHKAKEWVHRMKNADGTTGPHWTMEQAEKLMKQKGIECDPVMFWACLNAEYSARCEVYKKYGIDSPNFYADCVKAFWLEDENANEEKVAAYYTCVAKQ